MAWIVRGFPRLTILRVESLDGAIGVSGATLSVAEIEQYVRELHTGTADQKRTAEKILARFVDAWNRKRDRRPQFATNRASVQDILLDYPWSGTDWGWVADLHDHLRLGAYVPKASGEPFPILIMVYPLTDVIAGCRPAWDGRVAVPTVLDGDLFAYFFPSPIAPDPKMAGEHYPVGRTLNLREGLDTNNYDDYSAPQDAAGRWLARFRDKPSEALDGALTGRAHLGTCNTLPPSVALGQLLVILSRRSMGSCCAGSKRAGARSRCPGATRRPWLRPCGRSICSACPNAGAGCTSARLPITAGWRPSKVGGPATPLDALFTTLATVQPDRALESFWLRLSRLEGQTPLAHGRVALAGLRLLPRQRPCSAA